MKLENQIKEESFEFADKVAKEGLNLILFTSKVYRGDIFVITKETKDAFFGNNSFPVDVNNKQEGSNNVVTFSNLPGSNGKKYTLGSLCKYKHDFEGTGKSVRYKSNACVFCANKLDMKTDKKVGIFEQHRTKINDEIGFDEHPTKINNGDVIVFLADVLADFKGSGLCNAERDEKKLKLYKTKCRNNHNVEGTGYTLRYAIGGGCIHCDVEDWFTKKKKKKKVILETTKDRKPTVVERLGRFGDIFRNRS